MRYKYQLSYIIVLLVSTLSWQHCAGPQIHEEGKNLYEQGKYGQAISVLKTKIEENPDNAMLRYYLGLAYLGKKDLTSALDAYHAAEKMSQNTRMDSVFSAKMAEQAREFRMEKEYNAVETWTEHALQLDKRNRLARYEKNLSKGMQLYFQGSKWELWDAIIAFGNASAIMPENPLPYYYSGKAYTKKDDKDFSNAIEQYEMALERNPPEKIKQDIKSELEELNRRKNLYEDFWGN